MGNMFQRHATQPRLRLGIRNPSRVISVMRGQPVAAPCDGPAHLRHMPSRGADYVDGARVRVQPYLYKD